MRSKPRSYLKARPDSLLKENIDVFNNVVLLFILEKILSEYDPDSRVSIIKHLLNNWNLNCDRRISREAQACRENIAASDSISEEFWGCSDKVQLEEMIEKILQNGKSTAFTIIDNTLNDMLKSIESRETTKTDGDKNE